MNSEIRTRNTRRLGMMKTLGFLVVVTAIAGFGFYFQDRSLPHARRIVAALARGEESAESHDAGDDHDHGEDEHNHDHSGHDEANSLELSPQARKNVGLTTATVELQAFVRQVTVPAIVTGRPGRTEIEVTAPLGGRVTRVYPIKGEAVDPGQPLFDLRLTHEELVNAQSEFLRTAEELDVVEREIERLKSVQVPGAIAGKTVRSREYEQQKLLANFNSQRQSLLLHGLTEEQVESILKTRKLVQGVTVVTPEHPENSHPELKAHPFTVRELNVKQGQYVDAGAPLCELMDYAELYIEGRGFEQDADELLRAAREADELGIIERKAPAAPAE